MRRVLAEVAPALPLIAFDAVPPFAEFLRIAGVRTRLISLDCDLTRPCRDGEWPDGRGAGSRGDGRDACDHLATLGPGCPVIVHSSNYSAVPVMLDTLRRGGWRATLITPFSDPESAWIETDWRAEVSRLLRD